VKIITLVGENQNIEYKNLPNLYISGFFSRRCHNFFLLFFSERREVGYSRKDLQTQCLESMDGKMANTDPNLCLGVPSDVAADQSPEMRPHNEIFARGKKRKSKREMEWQRKRQRSKFVKLIAILMLLL